MDYKQRYQEALKLAREYHKANIVGGTPQDNMMIEDIFPELTESEDEKIRKWLIGYFNQYIIDGMPQVFGNGLNVKDVITWLEKQVEQKPVDKVEPKFKVGDWVVTDKNSTVQIKAVNNGYYTIDNGMDFNISYIDRCWHLWTIEDAKEGDVLMDGDNVIRIFDGIEGMCFRSKFYYSYFTKEFYGIECVGSHKFAKPATKEQRDLLFQKMKEAGYEWDAEKKELKLLITNGGDFFELENCEQKPLLN